MASKAKGRRKARMMRKRKASISSAVIDPHVEVAAGVAEAIFETLSSFAGEEDPSTAVTAALDEAVAGVAAAVRSIALGTIIEAARLGALPWSRPDTVQADPEHAPPRAELVALIAVAAGAEVPGTPLAATGQGDGAQPVTDLLHGRLFGEIDRILRLAQIRDMAEVDPADPLAYVSAFMRGAEIWIRNTTYPEMLENTVLALFADSDVQAALRNDLGFDAREAITVLKGCHTLQVDRMNTRMVAMREAMESAMESAAGTGKPDESALAAAKAAWTEAWEGKPDAVALTTIEIASATSLTIAQVRSVLEFFTVDLGSATPKEVVDEYTGGNNPLRTHPVVAVEDRFMLVHDAQVLGAVRENLEQHLKSTPVWDRYQKQRGDLLETRTRDALTRILPDADYRDGFEYFIPATASENGGPPANYTKRVEGDHLVLLDDVALIVEDKAVAISPAARSGDTRRLRQNLTGIVTKAAEQSGRLRDRIVADKGVLIQGEGWLDLSHIREIHTIAVSLDDLTSVSTATAELVKAGILSADNVPWTVSTHDLDLITQLIDHPAEFLLYLRRRRNAETTVMFTAPDELDLFLRFLSTGLWVEPDPDLLRVAFPFLPPVKTAERRRYERQTPVYLTSHTDKLDEWYYSRLQMANFQGGGVEAPPTAKKPSMAVSPLRPLMDALRHLGSYGWLSTSATLLSGAFEAQARFARIPHDLLMNPFSHGAERSQTVPWPAPEAEDGWLMVWMTLPAARDRTAFEEKAKAYLRVKKHQLGMPRGVVFVFSESTKELVDAYFDDHTGPLEPALEKLLKHLKPPEMMTGQVHPAGKKRYGTKPRGKKRRR